MTIVERDVVTIGKDADGNECIDFPLTRLGMLEDSAEIKPLPDAEDYLALADSTMPGRMMKTPVGALRQALGIQNTDNTPDAEKPVSLPQQAVLDKKTDTEDFVAHISNTVSHVTSAEKEKWDSKADRDTFNMHISNCTAHITAAERGKWNSKLDRGSFENHTENTDIHITAAERQSWNGKANANHSHSAADVGAASQGHTHTAANVGAVPTSRKVNNKALSTDINLTAADVGAASQGHTHTAADVGAVPASRKINNKALNTDISLTAADVGAASQGHTHTAADVGAVPASRKINNKALNTDISLTAADVGAAPVESPKFIGSISLSRKNGTTVGSKSCATGNETTASGVASHSEGWETTASGTDSHAEGWKTTASGMNSHTEGNETKALGDNSHSEGFATTASGKNSHTEGSGTKTSRDSSHAEGYGTEASGERSHAEGYFTTASGKNSHTEGTKTTAIGENSHTEGKSTTAVGENSHTEGYNTTAVGANSHTEGYTTRAANFASHAGGHYNKEMTDGGDHTNTVGDAFVIGNGTSSTHSNAFRLTFSGQVYGLSNFNSSGADYAEYFEWLDGNPDSEDRVGRFVTLDGDKIRTASPGDYILGIVSGQPCIIGNADEDWLGRWKHDEFGRFVLEYLKATEETDENGNPISKVVDYETPSWRYKANPDYDPAQPYIERKDRAEWDAVGMLGVLAVRDDGSCTENGFCKAAADGTATAADAEMIIENGRITKGYRVLERVSGSVVKIVFR